MNKGRNPQKAIGFVSKLEDFNDVGINSRPWKTHKELANLSIQKEKGWSNLLENQGIEKKHWQKWHLKTCKTKSKNLYREDAKKHQTSPDFLSSFAIFASWRWECLYSSKILYCGDTWQLTQTKKSFSFLNCLCLIGESWPRMGFSGTTK